MQHHIIKFLTAIVMGAMLLTGCVKDNETNQSDPPISDSVPEIAPQSVSLTGTTWESVLNEDGYTDKSVLHFITDSTGTEYIYLGWNNQTVTEGISDIVYYFDSLTMNGSYYAITPYGNGEPWYFIYNPNDTTLTISGNNRIYHLTDE